MIRSASLVLFVLTFLAASGPAQQTGTPLDDIWPFVQQGKLDEALALAESLLETSPDDPMLHHAIGRIHFMQGDPTQAVEHLERCLSLGETPAWAAAWTHNVLGQSYMSLGKQDLAEMQLRKAIELDATPNCTRDARRALAALTGEDDWGKGALVGKPLPDFDFRGITGNSYGPADFGGNAVLIKFGPSW